MKRQVDNAFTRGLGGHGAGVSSRALPALQASFAPMPAEETPAGELIGTRLELAPMRAVDALRVWESIGGESEACTLVVGGDLETPAACRRDEATPIEARGRGAVAEAAGVEWIDEDLALCDALGLRHLLRCRGADGLTLVRVLGTVETADATWIRRAIHADRPAWTADFRAANVLRVDAEHRVELETLDDEVAMRLIAENVAQYLAAYLDRDPARIQRPWPWQIRRILSISGAMMLRPEETESFSTSVDLGVCTAVRGEEPAQQALIYDLPSDTWHDEE